MPNNNQEQNQKDFNSIYCVYLEDAYLVSANQLTALQTLALLCPFSDGIAVYEARGLIRHWDDTTFYYNICENNIPEGATSTSSRLTANTVIASESATEMRIYPNPSSGEVTVIVAVKDCIFEVYDVIGKKIMAQKLSDTETKVDVSALNNGSYLVKLTQNNQVLKTDKLIIHK